MSVCNGGGGGVVCACVHVQMEKVVNPLTD